LLLSNGRRMNPLTAFVVRGFTSYDE